MKAVIFDCFGVLTTGTWQAFLESLPDAATVDAASSLSRAYDAGFISKDEFLGGIKDVTGQEPKQVESLITSDITKNTPLLDYIRELRGRGIKIGLLSNIATNWIRDTFLSSEEQELFDDMVMSFEVGMVKPDSRIFHIACERLGTEPSETVFIDDIDRFVEAAKDEGMEAIIYKDFKQTKQVLEKILQNN